MTSFEEEFPSLKGGQVFLPMEFDLKLYKEREGLEDVAFYSELHIQKFCLDKERVRKAIEKLDQNVDPDGWGSEVHMVDTEELKKELGL